MKRTKLFAAVAALVFAMSLGLASCSNDDDNNNTDTGTTDTDNTAEALESAAFNLLRSVCDLARYDGNAEDEDGDGNWSGIETLPSNWQNATYTIDEGAVIGDDAATVYSYPCYDVDDALEFFSEMTGTQVSESDLTDGTYTWSYEGLGSLTFTKDTTDGDTLFATINFAVPALKNVLTQLKFIDYETFEAASQANSYKGKPYFGAGDIIKRNKDETFWMCVRPAGGTLQKDKSYWICLNPDEKNLITAKQETISYYDDNNKKQSGKWTFAKNLMSLKTAKAAYHTFSMTNDDLWWDDTYKDAANVVWEDLKKLGVDLRWLGTSDYQFCFAYGSYTKDSKRVTSGNSQNAYTKYVQPFLIGKSSLVVDTITENIVTVREGTKTMYSATDNYDTKYLNAIGIPKSFLGSFNFNSFLHTTNDDCEIQTTDIGGRAEPIVYVKAYYQLNSELKDPDRYFVFFSPELMIKDNKGTVSEAKNPLGSKYTVIYRSADGGHGWDWWTSLQKTERYVDGKRTDFATENK